MKDVGSLLAHYSNLKMFRSKLNHHPKSARSRYQTKLFRLMNHSMLNHHLKSALSLSRRSMERYHPMASEELARKR